MFRAKEVHSGRLIVRQYSDEELRAVTLTTDDPLGLGEVATTPPPIDQDMEFVAQYKASETVTCAFGHRHLRGFLLKDQAGNQYLIGKDCAADHYGLNWDGFAKDVSRSVDRQSDLRWLDELCRRVLDAQSEISGIISSPSVKAFDDLRLHVQGLPPAVLWAFKEACGPLDRWMTSTYRERDFAAERRIRDRAYEEYEAALTNHAPSSEKTRLKRIMMEASGRQIWKTTTRQVLRCPAPTVFRSGFKMSLRLENATKNISSQAANLLAMKRVSQPSLAAQTLSEATQAFDEILKEIADAAAMFSPNTLNALMDLFKGHEFGGITTTRLSYGIKFARSDHQDFILRLPQLLQPLDFSLHQLVHPRRNTDI